MLKQKLENSVFLGGDWCWDAHPFRVTEETKSMVLRNICFWLNQFLHCSAYENIIFCWVMHEQSIVDSILENLDVTGCEVKTVSLICDEQTLRERLEKDIRSGLRSGNIVTDSLARIPCYEKMETLKIDISGKTPEQIADELARL